MKKDYATYSILLVEDNIGDIYLIHEYLKEYFSKPKITSLNTFKDYKDEITSNPSYDLILLDLSLPDLEGIELIQNAVKFANYTPIIVLTGYNNLNFAFKSISFGISDYLIKDQIDAATLYKSIIYNIERTNHFKALQESEKKFNRLFHLSPIPMWVYEVETLNFLNVNDAAIKHYGYTKDEFLSMTIKEIRPKEEIILLEEALEQTYLHDKLFYEGTFKHKKKNNEIITVEIKSNIIDFHGKKAEIILANDITDKINYLEKIDKQNKQLQEIAWIQSHVVRAPIARIMSIINIFNETETSQEEISYMLSNILSSAQELDEIIQEITQKSTNIYRNELK